MLTEPEFSVKISESYLVVGRGAVEIHGAIFPSLKHLKYYHTMEHKYDKIDKIKMILTVIK